MTQPPPSLNEKIADILAQEDAIAQRQRWKGRLKHIWQAENRLDALKTEILTHLSKKALFTLFLIMAFVFALTLSVL